MWSRNGIEVSISARPVPSRFRDTVTEDSLVLRACVEVRAGAGGGGAGMGCAG